ncbi:MAG: hypothetical protein LBF22_09115 [Deltaproteobacteria bacterium]|nr:hypothetical protein [Deltaproteobacteria bacterium]
MPKTLTSNFCDKIWKILLDIRPKLTTDIRPKLNAPPAKPPEAFGGTIFMVYRT